MVRFSVDLCFPDQAAALDCTELAKRLEREGDALPRLAEISQKVAESGQGPPGSPSGSKSGARNPQKSQRIQVASAEPFGDRRAMI